MNTEELTANLANFHGTENWYRVPFNPTFLYTDGVQYFAEQAEAYWMIDAVALGIYGKKGMVPQIVPEKTPFAVVTLTVSNRQRATLECWDDLPGNCLKRHHIPYTDCPEGVWKFYLEADGQHVVMLLPGEH